MQPEGYVEVQRRVNSHHTDGSEEHEHEEAPLHAKALARWIKDNNLICESVLDAGCRTGYAMDAWISEFPAARVAGCDIVPEFVKRADLRSEAIVADLQDLPYEDQEFDWVFCTTAIEHCPDAHKAAGELMRVARLGIFIVTDLEDDERFSKNPSHFTHHNDPAEWVDVCRHPDFWLLRLSVPRYSRIDMLWVRREHFRYWNKEKDSWRIPTL